MISTAVEMLDQLIKRDPQHPRAEKEREVVAVSALMAHTFGNRSLNDAHRFAQAIKAGDDAYCVVRSIPGEHRAEIRYHSALSRELRGRLGF